MSLLWQQCAGTLLWECHLHSSGSALYTFCVSLINSYNNTKDFFVPFIVQLSSNNLYILSQSNVKYYELKRKWFLSMNTKIVQISRHAKWLFALCVSLSQEYISFSAQKQVQWPCKVWHLSLVTPKKSCRFCVCHSPIYCATTDTHIFTYQSKWPEIMVMFFNFFCK